jgi:energy-coupling factor transporter ATP-binding protein EcfA2
MSTKIIYSMVGVGKTYPPSKQVLRDISLSYFYGAKIGVIGLNGAGKSTLLRIMAGVEKAFNGETVLAPGYTIGSLEQEPVLDDAKTVRAIVEEGVHEVVDALREFEDINAQFAADLSEDAMEALLARQASVQDDECLGSRQSPGTGDGRFALSAGRYPGSRALRWRAPPRRAVPSAAQGARHPAARRTHQPPGRGVSRVA